LVRPAHHFVALTHRNFRLLWLSLLVSFTGTFLQNAALLWHVSLLAPPGRKGLALGLMGLARLVPIAVFSLVGGVVADAWDRRRLLLVTQGASALVAAALAGLTFNGIGSVGPIYVLAALMGGPQLGGLEAGLVAQWLGAVISVVTGGIGCLVATASVLPLLLRCGGTRGEAECGADLEDSVDARGAAPGILPAGIARGSLPFAHSAVSATFANVQAAFVCGGPQSRAPEAVEPRSASCIFRTDVRPPFRRSSIRPSAPAFLPVAHLRVVSFKEGACASHGDTGSCSRW
jgi:hypothetical protein